MPKTVLLRHDLSDGSFHFDWLLEPVPGALRLIAFRLGDRVDLARTTEFDGHRLCDHRPLYLDFEGELTDNRGQVTRLAFGEVEILANREDRLDLSGSLGSARGGFTGVRADGALWRFRFFPQP